MDNLISLYRGLPGNRQFNGIQGLPYFVFNPLRNLLFTKEDISAETQNEILLGGAGGEVIKSTVASHFSATG